MLCEDCEYRRAGDLLSLDAPEGDGSVTILDQQEAPGPRMEDVIADRDLLARLIKRLRELDPDADTILALWQEDHTLSDRAIFDLVLCEKVVSHRTSVDAVPKYSGDVVKGFTLKNSAQQNPDRILRHRSSRKDVHTVLVRNNQTAYTHVGSPFFWQDTVAGRPCADGVIANVMSYYTQKS